MSQTRIQAQFDPREWYVTTRGSHWYIENGQGGRKKIGPVSLTGVNYYDRAKAEAVKRNSDLGLPAQARVRFYP